MADSNSLAELYSNGIFAMSAPVLKINDTYYDTSCIFDNNNIKKEICDLI